jgi:hypothetical protein
MNYTNGIKIGMSWEYAPPSLSQLLRIFDWEVTMGRIDTDGNVRALEYEERSQLKKARIESLFNSNIEPILQELEDLARQVKNLVDDIEEDYGYDFGDEALEAITEAVRVRM